MVRAKSSRGPRRSEPANSNLNSLTAADRSLQEALSAEKDGRLATEATLTEMAAAQGKQAEVECQIREVPTEPSP